MNTSYRNKRFLGRLGRLKLVPYLLAFAVFDIIKVEYFGWKGFLIWFLAYVGSVTIHLRHNLTVFQSNQLATPNEHNEQGLSNVDRSRMSFPERPTYDMPPIPRRDYAHLPLIGRNSILKVFIPYAIAFAIIILGKVEIRSIGAIMLLISASIVAWEIQFTLGEKQAREEDGY